MVLFLHNRYRTTGGEERVVDDLLRLVRERLDEPAELIARDSGALSPTVAGIGLLRGGLDPGEVGAAVRARGARVVHAHNLQPAFGWRALAAARRAGARIVLHLHQYRLVCAVGVCFTEGEECTRCHGRNTMPGVLRGCRPGRSQALVYGAGLAIWQRRLVEQADVVLVPSVFARERLRQLGAPLPWDRVHVLAPPVEQTGPSAPAPGGYALVASRLAAEKGVDVAINACRAAGMSLVIAGDGPERSALEAQAEGSDVRFLGAVARDELARLRGGAALAIVPSRSAETFGLAAAEAMACGLPVAASRVGALPELLDSSSLAEPGDAASLAGVVSRLAGDREAGERGRRRVAELCAPDAVARRLSALYDGSDPT